MRPMGWKAFPEITGSGKVRAAASVSTHGLLSPNISASILDCEPPIDLDDLKRKEIPLRRGQNCRRKRVSL